MGISEACDMNGVKPHLETGRGTLECLSNGLISHVDRGISDFSRVEAGGLGFLSSYLSNSGNLSCYLRKSSLRLSCKGTQDCSGVMTAKSVPQFA